MKPQERFALIMSRQSRFEWGGEYIPSTLAVPREAPKGSRISRLHSQKLGRTLHLLSWPEKVFAQLALYHPDLFELHEQKMLWPVNTGHPLRGHPLAKGTFPPPLRGTVDIAREIGFKHHEIVVEGASGRCRMPYPYQGDLLLYLLNSRGNPYAVNWTVKDQVEAFRERRSTTTKTPVQQRKDREHAELRGELERRYYASAGVRTVEVSRDLVTPTIQANLDLLFGMHDLDYTLEPALLDDFSGAVAEAVQMGKPVAYVAIEHGARWGARDQFIARIYQDIWDRRLLVDFSEPILIDRPFLTGGCDLLQEFSSFFEETAL